MNWQGKRYWLIGASEGLGRALALELAAQGAEVIASARSAQRLAELAEQANIRSLPVDITDREAVQQAVQSLPDIDGCIYCAGAYEPLAAAQWDAATIAQMVAVNFTGALHVVEAVLPRLQAQGHLAFIGSLAGLRGLPRAQGYGTSKAALMHLAQSLRADLDPRQTRVQLINPGFIRTRLTDKNDFKMPSILTPEAAARLTRKALERRRFRSDFPRAFALLFTLLGGLPSGLYFPLVRRMTL